MTAGHGTVVSGGDASAEGRLVALLDVDDLLAAMDAGEQDLVAYLVHPNVTMMAPIYDSLNAIVCEHGDDASHVAIVARELGIPCAVQTKLELPLERLVGQRVRLEPTGELIRIEGEGT
jgi:phosphoenolpyruvate-protein kinase (PTS system EI component)